MQKSLQNNNLPHKEDAIALLPDWLKDESSLKEVLHWGYNWEAIGAKVRQRRIQSGMSLRSAARWMSISAAYLSDLERGIMPWSESRLRDITNVIDMAERLYQPK